MIYELPLPILLAVLACSYVLGSTPFGVIVTRLGGAGDLRAVGSGNIGATNVLRTGRKDLALLTLLGDGGKGVVAVLAARRLFGDDVAALAGGAAFFGHIFPIWLRFRGGKGVATFFGVMLTVAWPVGLAAAVTWLVVAAALRWSSLAALAAAALAPLAAVGLHQSSTVIGLSLFTAVLIFYRHQENIRRLRSGQEPKIGSKKASAA
jgi:glycerol-3-phosphate acyltransferase PlsY